MQDEEMAAEFGGPDAAELEDDSAEEPTRPMQFDDAFDDEE